MKPIYIGWLASVLLLQLKSSGQNLLGLVVEKDLKGKELPLEGANVHWLGTNKGTITKSNGVFLIARLVGPEKLVISFVGYQSDTILIDGQTNLKVELKSEQYLQEVTVQGWRPSSQFDQASGINVVVM